MNQTVIGEIYHSFSKKELKQLDKYIHSSQWQNSETIVKCHECISLYTSKKKLDELDKERIFQYVYEGESYNDVKLRFTFNRLIQAIKEFIVLLELENKSVFSEKIWMDFLLSRKLKKNLQYNLENSISSPNSEYKFLFDYFKSQENNFNQFNFSKDIKAQYSSIIEIMKSAEIFSDLVFIKQYCSLISFTNVYQSIPFNLPIHKLNEIKEKKWENELPEFSVYMKLIDLLINKDLTSYESYKKILFEKFDIWDDEEKVNFLASLLNFTTVQINKGDSRFIDEQYTIFNYFEEKNIFKIKNFINHTRMNNVVHIYLRKKEFEKAEKFVTKYVELLDSDLIDSCRHFNIARIKFENKFYKESLRELLQVDFGKDPFYSINSKFLLLKNYYELRESDALDSLCVSFKEYVRKNKVISENYKLSSLNFIRMLEKIYGTTPQKAKKIELELINSAQIAEKSWLLEKINEKKTN